MPLLPPPDSEPQHHFSLVQAPQNERRGAAAGCEACIENIGASVVMPVMPFASRLAYSADQMPMPFSIAT